MAGSVIESEAVESLALSGGFLGLMAGIELVLAGVVIGVGAGGCVHALLLLVWVALSLLIATAYWRQAVIDTRWCSAMLQSPDRATKLNIQDIINWFRDSS